MKKKLIDNKGLSLIVLMITLVLMAILLGVIIRKVDIGADIKNYDYMCADIELLESIVLQGTKGYSVYDGDSISITKADLHGQASPQDGPNYYTINTSKLNNVLLNFGGGKNNKDIYIVNEQSLRVYYLKGIKLEGAIYHRKK